MSDPSYPIGKFTYAGPRTNNQRSKFIDGYRTDSGSPPGSGARPDAAAGRNSLPRWRMDSAASHPPCARKPHECLHPLQTGVDRRHAHHQAIYGGSLGKSAGCAVYSGGGFAELARLSAQIAGCACCARCSRRTGSVPSIIRNWEACRWRKIWRCIPGTDGITWPT